MEKQLVDDVSARPPPGKLGRYAIVKRLASGETADLLLARTAGGAARHIVIKQLREPQAKDAAFVKTFVAEARLAVALHHHNIVQVQDVGDDDDTPYVAMQYVHGEDLRKIVARLHGRAQAMPLQHLVAIGTSIAAALHHAHEQRGADRKPLGIVHGDLTPANILVGYDGNVKVVDFGVGKAAIQTIETQADGLKGKVPYLAPEQCTGQGVDRRSDVFALGIVLYELATTRRLFQGESNFLTMAAIVAGTVPRPSQHHKELPAELENIILKALARSPADRYQTAADLRVALDGFATKAKLTCSATALALYMTELFGRRAEPWLDTAEPTAVSAIDFDGSVTGLAQPSADAVEMFAIPDAATSNSPIAHAHAHAVADKPTAIMPLAKKSVALDSFVQNRKPDANGTSVAPEANRTRPRSETSETPVKAAGNRLPSSTRTPRSIPVVAPPVPAPPRAAPPVPAPPVPAPPVPAPPRAAPPVSAPPVIAPPPPIAVTSAGRNAGDDPTQIVAPLPSPFKPSKRPATGTAAAGKRTWIVAGLIGATAIVTVILVVAIGFSSDDVARTPAPASLEHTATTAPEPQLQPPAPAPPPPEAPRPERTMRNSEPPPATDVSAQVPAEPPPAEVQVSPKNAITPPTAGATASPPPPPPTEVATPPTEVATPPRRASPPSKTHRPAQVARSTVKAPAKLPAKPQSKPSTKPGKTPAYDPDALFLKKP